MYLSATNKQAQKQTEKEVDGVAISIIRISAHKNIDTISCTRQPLRKVKKKHPRNIFQTNCWIVSLVLLRTRGKKSIPLRVPFQETSALISCCVLKEDTFLRNVKIVQRRYHLLVADATAVEERDP
jgi:hypothetical protein